MKQMRYKILFSFICLTIGAFLVLIIIANLFIASEEPYGFFATTHFLLEGVRYLFYIFPFLSTIGIIRSKIVGARESAIGFALSFFYSLTLLLIYLLVLLKN